VLTILLLLIALIGSTEFYSLADVCTFAFQVSYAIPFFLKVFFICPNAKIMLETSPISLGGWSFYLSLVAFFWLSGTACILLLPTESPITATNMNYTSVVAVGVIFFGILNWELNTKHHFKGTKRADDDHKDDDILGDDDATTRYSAEPNEKDSLLRKDRRVLL
jgi:hypothetical protein